MTLKLNMFLRDVNEAANEKRSGRYQDAETNPSKIG